MDIRSEDQLDIAVIAPSRLPIRQPYAGGLEVVVAKEVSALRDRGHRVTLFAAIGSEGHDRRYEFTTMASITGFGDSFYPPGGYEADSAEFHRLMDHLAVSRFDVILNHSLSHVPLERAVEVSAPMITTLHCPPLGPMQDAFDRLGDMTGHVVAVSRSVLRSWRIPHGADVLPNAVDTQIWRPRVLTSGPSTARSGAARAVWMGRIVPEKGPHLAVEVARRAGLELDVAGRVGDESYMRRVLAPRLRAAGEGVRFRGPLGRDALVPLVAGASVALVTPCWEEPFGLTSVEALACGTPVVALARGGTREILDGQPGVVLVEPGADPVSALVAAIPAALAMDRRETARAAARAFSHDTRVDSLETRLRGLLVGVGAS